MGTGNSGGSEACNLEGSFLGVGNPECISKHLGYASFLLAVIVGISIVLDFFLEWTRAAIKCPQMKRVVNRFFEELMIMGFISMCIFAIDTSGLLEKVSFGVSDLSPLQLLHFQEFFHYVVFMTTVYYVAIMLLLVVIATVVPRLLYGQGQTEPDRDPDPVLDDTSHRRNNDDEAALLDASPSDVYPRQYDAKRVQRQVSGFDLVNGSRMYFLLRQRYKREGWSFRFNLVKQFALWKSFELLAHNVCQHRSGYLYKNPAEMQRIFGLSYRSSHHVDFARFQTLCTRNLLASVTHMHYTTFTVLIVLVMMAGTLPTAATSVFLGLAGLLGAMAVVIMVKTLRILKGIIKDRLRVLTMEDVAALLPPHSTVLASPASHRRPSFKAVAQMVRALVRMQMSVLCHRQLHYHDARFWFRSPMFLLRLFQLSTTGQAFYLVWLTLVIAKDPHVAPWMTVVMVLVPLLSLFVVTPLTMPSLVLVMSLTGFFVEQNPHGANNDGFDELLPQNLSAKDRIRIARKSYLRSVEELSPTSASQPIDPRLSVSSKGSVRAQPPTPDMFLHMYDILTPPLTSPAASALYAKRMRRSPAVAKTPCETDYSLAADEAPARFFPESTKFLNYCSSYGGYPTNQTDDGDLHA
ncbi:hypothetical protein ACHHYP_08862 [Achlya hypogyna]|uniref:Transmembrane protein n=1 Tax=Achlya hypogyna TaxID=1202772 RepID=A0A1V9YP21_ACHHY|nr:hypothetical protein ACHHYP_08862 [Achlya hypogyna]